MLKKIDDLILTVFIDKSENSIVKRMKEKNIYKNIQGTVRQNFFFFIH